MPVYIPEDAPPVAISNDVISVAPGIPEASITVISQSGQPATGAVASGPATAIRLIVSATAAVTSPVIDRAGYRGPAALVIANIGGATPTVFVDIQGSVDNVNFYNAAYALVGTPNTVAVAQIAITTTATTTYLLLTDQAWRYLRIVTSTVLNEVYSVTYYQ